MDDVALRDLERRFEASGAPDDGARLVTARLRVGALGAPAVDLAAALGEPSALAALGRPAPAPLHPWHASVRAALARRLLWRAPDAPLPVPRLARVGAEESAASVRVRLLGHPVWELRVEHVEHETALLLRAPRGAFRDLGEMWAELALPHRVISNAAPGETIVDRASRYLMDSELAAGASPPLPRALERSAFEVEVRLGAHGLRDLWPGPRPRVAWALSREVYESHSVAETERDHLVYFWETIA